MFPKNPNHPFRERGALRPVKTNTTLKRLKRLKRFTSNNKKNTAYIRKTPTSSTCHWARPSARGLVPQTPPTKTHAL